MSWRDNAACRGADTALFFGHDTRAAIEFCARCDVRADCSQAGNDGDEHGVWGGENRSTRRRSFAWCYRCGTQVSLGRRYCDPCRVDARRESWQKHKLKARAS